MEWQFPSIRARFSRGWWALALKRKGRLLRIFLDLLLFLGLVAGTAVVVRPFQKNLLARMNEVREAALSGAETALGRRIHYGSLGPSIFGTLDLRDVRIVGPDQQPVVSVARLRIGYDLWALIRADGWAAIKSLRLDAPEIRVDADRDQDLLDLFSPADPSAEKPGPSRLASLFEGRIIFRIRGGSATFTRGGERLRVEAINLDAETAAKRLRVNGSFAAATQSQGDLAVLGEIRLRTSFSGDLESSLRQGSLTLAFSQVSSALFSLRSLTVNLSLADNLLELRKIQDKLPFDVFFRYQPATDQWSGEFKAEGFAPRDIVELRGPWRASDPWLGGILSGSATARAGKNTPPYVSCDLVASLPRELPFDLTRAAIKGAGTASRFQVDSLSLTAGEGNVFFEGDLALAPFQPSGRLRVERLPTSGGALLDADLRIGAEDDAILVYGESLTLGGLVFSALDLRLGIARGVATYDFSALSFADLESYEDVGISRISSTGTYARSEGLLQASLAVDAFAARDILELTQALARVPPLSAALRQIVDQLYFTTELFISADADHFSFSAPRFVVAYQGDLDIFAVASLSGTESRFALDEGNLIWSGGSAEFSGGSDYSDPEDIEFAVRASFRDAVYYLDAILLEHRQLSLQGSYGLSANMTVADSGALSGYIETRGMPLPFLDQAPLISLAAHFRYSGPAFWSVDLNRLEIGEIRLPNSLAARALLRGSVDQEGASLQLDSFDDGRGPLSGRVEATWQAGFSEAELTLRIADAAGQERYEAEARRGAGTTELRLYAANAQLPRLVKGLNSAVATGELRIAWESLSSYAMDLRLSSLQARVGEREIALTGSGSLDPRRLDVENLKIRYGALLTEIPALRLDRSASRAQASTRIRGTVMNRELDVTLETALSMGAFESWDQIAAALTTMQGSLLISSLRFGAWQGTEPIRLDFERTERLFTLRGGAQDSLRAQLSKDGAFYAAFSQPAPLRGAVTGTVRAGTIDARTENLYLDFSALWKILPLQHIVDFTGGIFSVSARIAGPLGDPEFFGRAEGTSIRVRVPDWVNGELGPSAVQVVFDGNQMRFGPVRIAAESGAGQVQGQFTFDRWVPSVFTLDIGIEPDQPVPFRFDLFGVRSTGLTSGSLSLGLGPDGFRLGGALVPQNALITLDAKTIAENRNAPVAAQVPIFVDLGLTTGKKVEFVWPSEEFPIVRGYADVGTGLRITADGAAGRFSMTGPVSLQGGEVFYFQRSFYIREGMLDFNENEFRFDPHIAVRAELRDQSIDGPVTIALVVDDAPLSVFTPRLESDPALSQVEIFALLGQNLNVGAADSTTQFQEALITASSDVLAQFNVIRVFERSVRDTLNLDMFSVRTQVIQNAVLEATGLRTAPVDRITALGNYFDNTTVFLGKYLGPDLFVQSMLSLRYDETRAYDLFGGLTLEPDFGLELKTPLFNLQWNFVPLNPQNLFIDDHAFTLSWKWSF